MDRPRLVVVTDENVEAAYVVVEQSPDLVGDDHDRRRRRLDHLAFHAGGRADVDRLVDEAAGRGWTLLFPDRHPYAGGANHCAGYLASTDGFEVELVARGTVYG